jgi:peptidoglycan hydrolase CwlO-like protein
VGPPDRESGSQEVLALMSRPLLHGPCPGPRRGLSGLLATLAFGLAVGAASTAVLRGAPAVEVIDAQRGQVRELEGELQRIDAEAAAAAGAHAEARRRVDELRGRIHQTTAALAEAERAHRIAVRRLSDRLVALYLEEPPTLVEVVLTSGGLSEAVDAQRALEAVSAEDRRVVTGIEESKARLTRVRAELEAGRREAQESARTASARLSQLDALLATRRAVLDQARARLDQLISQERHRKEAAAARRERAAAIEAAGERAEERLRRQADPETATSLAPAPDPGPAPAGGVAAHLERIAQCESGGNPRAVSASGQYRGKYQFDPGTWAAVGGTGDPAAASEAEQDRRAAILYARSGPAPWPVCGYR